MDVLKYLEDILSKPVIFIIAVILGGSWWVYSVEGRLATAADKTASTDTHYAVLVKTLEEFKKDVQRHNEEDIHEKTKLGAQLEALAKEVSMIHQDLMMGSDHDTMHQRRQSQR